MKEEEKEEMPHTMEEEYRVKRPPAKKREERKMSVSTTAKENWDNKHHRLPFKLERKSSLSSWKKLVNKKDVSLSLFSSTSGS